MVVAEEPANSCRPVIWHGTMAAMLGLAVPPRGRDHLAWVRLKARQRAPDRSAARTISPSPPEARWHLPSVLGPSGRVAARAAPAGSPITPDLVIWHPACRRCLVADNRSIARVMRGKSVGIHVKTP